jgi:AcrR family transcriptional regulator
VRIKTPQQAGRILGAAAKLFATHRFHEARMEDIAALAEVSKGTLYRYFTNKDELYLALLSQAAEEFGERLDVLDAEEADPRQRLESLVSAVLEFFDARPHVFDLIQHAEALQRPTEPFPWAPIRDRVLALTYAILDDARRSRTWSIDDPELAALMLLGGLRALIRFGSKPRPGSQSARIIDGFIRGYCSLGPGASGGLRAFRPQAPGG